LIGIIETAEDGIFTFEKIIKIRQKYENAIIEKMGKRGKLARELLMYLFTDPVVSAKNVEVQLKISAPTANALIKEMTKADILKERTGFSRNRVFILWEYFSCFN
jgi:Fic family protein